MSDITMTTATSGMTGMSGTTGLSGTTWGGRSNVSATDTDAETLVRLREDESDKMSAMQHMRDSVRELLKKHRSRQIPLDFKVQQTPGERAEESDYTSETSEESESVGGYSDFFKRYQEVQRFARMLVDDAARNRPPRVMDDAGAYQPNQQRLEPTLKAGQDVRHEGFYPAKKHLFTNADPTGECDTHYFIRPPKSLKDIHTHFAGRLSMDRQEHSLPDWCTCVAWIIAIFWAIVLTYYVLLYGLRLDAAEKISVIDAKSECAANLTAIRLTLKNYVSRTYAETWTPEERALDAPWARNTTISSRWVHSNVSAFGELIFWFLPIIACTVTCGWMWGMCGLSVEQLHKKEINSKYSFHSPSSHIDTGQTST